jgi:hypothetical protein
MNQEPEPRLEREATSRSLNRLNMRKKRAREPEEAAIYKYIHDKFKEDRVEISYESARARLAGDMHLDDSDAEEGATDEGKRKSGGPTSKPLRLLWWDGAHAPSDSLVALCNLCNKRGTNLWFGLAWRVKHSHFFLCRPCADRLPTFEAADFVVGRKPDLLKVRLWLSYFHLARVADCPCCLRKRVLDAYQATWHKAHRVARSRGGSDDLANLLPTCADCNLAMGAHGLEEYRARLGLHPPVPAPAFSEACVDATLALLLHQ